MTEITYQQESRIDGHLRFLNEAGAAKSLSGYTFEILDSRARQGLRRWFHITPHEAVVTNPTGVASPEELEADIHDFVSILSLDDIHVEGWIDVAPNDCESITYTVSGNVINVTRQRCN